MEGRAPAAGHDTTSGDSPGLTGRVPKSLVWSNTPSLLLTFAVRAPPLGLLPLLPLLNSEKLVLKQQSFSLLLSFAVRAPPRAAAGAAAAEFRAGHQET